MAAGIENIFNKCFTLRLLELENRSSDFEKINLQSAKY